MNRRNLLPAVVAASLLAAACGSGASDDTSATNDTAAAIDETPATEPEPAAAEPEPTEPEPVVTDAPIEPAATEPAPAPTDAPTTTAAPTTTEAAPEPPAAPTFEPLAVIDVGSTGGGNFPVSDLEAELLDTQVEGIPIPNAASLVSNTVVYESNRFPAADGGVQHGSNFQFTTQVTTDMPITDIVAAYKVPLDEIGDYEYTDSESSTDTRSQAGFQATGDGESGRLAQYIITVSSDSETPGVVQIDARRIAGQIPGEMPLPTGPAAVELAVPMQVAADNDIAVLSWRYDIGYFNSAFGGGASVSSLFRLDFGAGDDADIPAAAMRTQELFGPAIEQVEARPDLLQLKYGEIGSEAPEISVQAIESGESMIQIEWRVQRMIEAV